MCGIYYVVYVMALWVMVYVTYNNDYVVFNFYTQPQFNHSQCYISQCLLKKLDRKRNARHIYMVYIIHVLYIHVLHVYIHACGI